MGASTQANLNPPPSGSVPQFAEPSNHGPRVTESLSKLSYARNISPLPRCNCESEDEFVDWLNQFERRANAFSWSYLKRCKTLGFLVDGKTSRAYDSANNLVYKGDWLALKAHMIKTLIPPDTEMLLQAELSARKQRANESVKSYSEAY